MKPDKIKAFVNQAGGKELPDTGLNYDQLTAFDPVALTEFVRLMQADNSADYQTKLVEDLTDGRIAVPKGWQLVPIEPTEAMLSAIAVSGSMDYERHVYKTMLKAAMKEGVQ